MLALLENGYRVTIIDNFDNAFQECFTRMQRLAGDKADKLKLIKVARLPFSALAPSWPQSPAHVCQQRGEHTLNAGQGDLRNFDDIDAALATDKCAAAG